MDESVCVSDRPGHSQLDEVHQVLAAVADGAGLEALALTGVTPGGRRENLQLKCPTVKVRQEEHQKVQTQLRSGLRSPSQLPLLNTPSHQGAAARIV